MQNTKVMPQNRCKSKSNSHQQEWIKFLYCYGNRLEYQRIEDKSKNAMFAIMRYRRLLRSRGFGNISFIALNTAYTQRDYIKLHNLLQELFLELITKEQFEYVLREIDKTENNMTKLYEKHMQNKNARILNRVLLL